MRTALRTLGRGTATAAALLLVVGLVKAGESDAKPSEQAPSPADMAKIIAQAAAPGPQHAKLKSLVGSWTYTCKTWMDPSQPPVETAGTIERKLILGGRFLKEKFAGTGFDGKPGFEGFNLIGYDNSQEKYTSVWACNMGTNVCNGLGTADESGKTITFETEIFCPIRKKMIHGRDEVRIESDDKVVVTSYMTVDGKESKIMEIVSVRKK